MIKIPLSEDVGAIAGDYLQINDQIYLVTSLEVAEDKTLIAVCAGPQSDEELQNVKEFANKVWLN